MWNISAFQTYSTDYQTADSAATATAMLCGEKCENNVIALSQFANAGDCASQQGTQTPSIMTLAMEEGKRQQMDYLVFFQV